MPDQWLYVSILKGRLAEYAGLAELDRETSDRVTPIIQLWPGSSDDQERPPQLWPDDGQDAVSGDLVARLLTRVRDRWPEDRPLLLDGDWLENPAAFRGVLGNCRAAGRRPLPVTGLNRTRAYQTVVAEAGDIDRLGCVVRLGRDDFPPYRTDVGDRLEDLMASLGRSPAETDLLLDLRHVERDLWERDAVLAEAMIRTLPHLHEWRNLALAATGMPATAAGYQTNEIEPFPRLEWWIWQRLDDRRDVLARMPTFGDYGVIHPDRVEDTAGSRNLPLVPQIRYTTQNECLMVRGEDIKRAGSEHVQPLMERLMKRPEWSGTAFSKGDGWIAAVAAGSPNTGNRVTWKRVGLIHHLTFVSRQLATPLGL